MDTIGRTYCMIHTGRAFAFQKISQNIWVRPDSQELKPAACLDLVGGCGYRWSRNWNWQKTWPLRFLDERHLIFGFYVKFQGCTKNGVFNCYPEIFDGSLAPHLVGKYIILGSKSLPQYHRVVTLSPLPSDHKFPITITFFFVFVATTKKSSTSDYWGDKPNNMSLCLPYIWVNEKKFTKPNTFFGVRFHYQIYHI